MYFYCFHFRLYNNLKKGKTHHYRKSVPESLRYTTQFGTSSAPRRHRPNHWPAPVETPADTPPKNTTSLSPQNELISFARRIPAESEGVVEHFHTSCSKAQGGRDWQGERITTTTTGFTMVDYYKTLDVARTATEAEIKKA